MGRWWTLVYELADVKLILNSKDSELSFLESLNDCMKRMLPKKFTLVPRHGFFLNVFREANMPLIAQWLVEEVPEIVSLMLLPPAPPASASPAPAPAGAIDLFKTCRHIAMRISLRVLFGSQIFVNERYDRYYDSFAPIYPEERLLDGLILLLRDPNRKERAWDTITQITGEMLDHYIKLEKKAEGGECECVMHFLVRQHLEQQQQEQQSGTLTSSSSFSTLDLETVLKDTFTFVWASNTSTYLVLAWCIWEMMGNKGNLQERVLAETSTKIDNNNNKTNPTNLAQVVDEWVVGKAMVDEVIRLQTPGLLLRKVMAPEGVTLSTGHHVPTGEFVGFSYPWLQTLPDFYHNPLEVSVWVCVWLGERGSVCMWMRKIGSCDRNI